MRSNSEEMTIPLRSDYDFINDNDLNKLVKG